MENTINEIFNQTSTHRKKCTDILVLRPNSITIYIKHMISAMSPSPQENIRFYVRVDWNMKYIYNF